MSKPKAKSNARAKSIPRTKQVGPIAKQPGELVDWRHQTLARMRALILEADPAMVERLENFAKRRRTLLADDFFRDHADGLRRVAKRFRIFSG